MNEKWKYAELPTIKPPTEKINLGGLISLGSCFARNFNRWLSFYDLTNQQMPWDILYNPFSLSMELIRLFEKTNWQEGIICKNLNSKESKKVIDPWRTWDEFNSLAELSEFNKNFDEKALAVVEKADCFLFTFGLAEIWHHIKNDVITNQLPLTVIKNKSNIWQSRFAQVHEITSIISKLIAVLRRSFNVSIPIVFTLSPVPLKYTFSGLSIRQANNISKSTILLALHEVATRERNVYYFPVYEIAQTLVEQEFSVWQEDGRHITAATIDFISRKFVSHYCGAIELPESQDDFWVPHVNKKGIISGRLYANGNICID